MDAETLFKSVCTGALSVLFFISGLWVLRRRAQGVYLAKIAQWALLEEVKIDGFYLPLPDDPRWRMVEESHLQPFVLVESRLMEHRLRDPDYCRAVKNSYYNRTRPTR